MNALREDAVSRAFEAADAIQRTLSFEDAASVAASRLKVWLSIGGRWLRVETMCHPAKK